MENLDNANMYSTPAFHIICLGTVGEKKKINEVCVASQLSEAKLRTLSVPQHWVFTY